MGFGISFTDIMKLLITFYKNKIPKKSQFTYLLISFLLIPTSSFAIGNSGKLILRKKFTYFNSSFESDYRYYKNNLNYRHYDLGIRVPFLETYAVSFNYRSVYKAKNNEWRIENRPHISLYKSLSTKLVQIQLRLRQEYSYISSNNTSFRERIRVMIKSNKEIFYFKPFISGEWFYNFDKGKYSKNRIFAGIEITKSKFIKYNFYYKYNRSLSGNGNWNSDYSIVFKLIYNM